MRKIFSPLLAAFVAALLLTRATQVSADDLVVIELQHRSAEDILPVLKPLAGPNVAISGIDYKLLVRGSSADVTRLREAVAVLDRAQRQLMISVRYGASPQATTNDVRITGTVSDRDTRIAGRGSVTNETANDSETSSIRVLEGNRAFISSGQNVPVITTVAIPSATGPVIAGATTDYRELTSGFSVLPRVNGRQVILEIATQQMGAINDGRASSGAANVQRANTTLMGQLGEWISLGGVASSTNETRTGIGSRRVQTQSDQRTIAIKVEDVERK